MCILWSYDSLEALYALSTPLIYESLSPWSHQSGGLFILSKETGWILGGNTPLLYAQFWLIFLSYI